MDDKRLITIEPARKEKRFNQDYLRLPPTPRDAQVQERIALAAGTPAYDALPEPQRRHVDLVVASYRRRLAGLGLAPEHYVLGGHELVEFDRLPDEHVLRYVAYRYKFNRFPELKLLDDYPPVLQVEPASVCNFRCVMCFQSDATFSGKGSPAMGHMSLATFRKVVDQAEGHVEALTLASRGEPLLNRDIVPMLAYAKGKFLGLKVNTNASLLTERLVHALLDCEPQTIVFSIDAAEKDMYEKIRVGGNFERLVRNLEMFQRIRAGSYPRSRTIVRISGVKINEAQDIGAMDKMWSRFADIVAFTEYNPWQSAYDNPVNDIQSPCTDLWRRMFVWWDGKVNPCDYDYKSMLSQWSLASITVPQVWTSPGYQRLREHHLKQERAKVEPCRRCVAV